MALYSKPKPGKMDPKPCRRCGKAPGTVIVHGVSESDLASAGGEGWLCDDCMKIFQRNESATS